MIAGGLNAAIRENGASIGKKKTKGVKDVRLTSHNVQRAVFTVLDVQSEGGHIEKAVVAATKEIWRLGSYLYFAVVDINKKVGRE